ncbi:MAG: metallophosphoesterase [Chitinophagaceae bacterium]|nr:MAG: metallophosphoesterase [Chitinophagaceae bacterium]
MNFSALIIPVYLLMLWQIMPDDEPVRQKPLKILVISDLNSAYGSVTYSPDVLKVISKIDSIKPDLILCGGDMVAGQKATLTADQTSDMWTAFKAQILDPIHRRGVPFGFTIGNHDGSPGFLQDRNLARQFWEGERTSTRLNFVDGSHYPFYYSFEQNGVFFISWDAAGAAIKADVYDWMQGQLQSASARKARMRIVLGHLPLYAIVADKNKPGEVNEDPARALRFFKEHDVDMYISGHQHAYFPATKEGVELFNAGAIGEGPRALLGDADGPIKTYSILQIPVRNPRRFTYTTVDPATGKSIVLSDLPLSISGFNGSIDRIPIR